MQKTKKLPLNSLQLQQHPTMMTLHSDDELTQSELPNMQLLSLAFLLKHPLDFLRRNKVGIKVMLIRFEKQKLAFNFEINSKKVVSGQKMSILAFFFDSAPSILVI